MLYPCLTPGISTAQPVVTFCLKEDNAAATISFVTGTNYFLLAESLGGIKSLFSHPANMTHKSIPADIRRRNGVCGSRVPLSVELEEAGDLLEDLEQAFEKCSRLLEELINNVNLLPDYEKSIAGNFMRDTIENIKNKN